MDYLEACKKQEGEFEKGRFYLVRQDEQDLSYYLIPTSFKFEVTKEIDDRADERHSCAPAQRLRLV